MSVLKSISRKELTAWIEVDGCPGFEVEVTALSRTELSELAKSCSKTVFNRHTKQKEQEIDSDLFAERFVERTVKGWKGFTFRHALNLIPAELPADTALDEEIEYSFDEALFLVKQSAEFDSWLNEVISDLTRFQPRGA